MDCFAEVKVCARASCNVIFPRFQKATRSRKNCCRTTRLPTKRRRRRWRRRRRRRVGLTRGQIQGGIIIFCDIWQWEVMLYSLYSYMKNDNDMQGEHSCWRSSWSEQSSGKAQSGRWWEKQQQQVETFLFIAFYEFFCSFLMTLINFRDDDTSNPASTSSTPLATKVWKFLRGKNLCRIKLYVCLELMINRSIDSPVIMWGVIFHFQPRRQE